MTRRKTRRRLPTARETALEDYSSAYHRLYNRTVEEAAGARSTYAHERYAASCIGITTWSAQEKMLFFRALDRLGRHNVAGIARAMSTGIGMGLGLGSGSGLGMSLGVSEGKSEPEIQAYLDLLHRAWVEHNQETVNFHGLLFAEIPAAVEVEAEVDEELDAAALALGEHQLQHDETVAKHRYGDLAILDYEAVDWLRERLVERDMEPTLHSDFSPVENAFALLRLEKMLDLSCNIFMNSSEPSLNWTTYATPENVPGVFASAFLDFHALVLGLTRRLVAATLMVAQSALRSTVNMDTRRRVVQRRDVLAACNVLGLPATTSAVWAAVPHHCRIDIQTGEDPAMDVTSWKDFDMTKFASPVADDDATEEESRQVRHDPSNTMSDENDSSDSMDLHWTDSRPPRIQKERGMQIEEVDAEDVYADACDERASCVENRHLKSILYPSHRRATKAEVDDDEMKTALAPRRKRKAPEYLERWEEHAPAGREWEMYGRRLRVE